MTKPDRGPEFVFGYGSLVAEDSSPAPGEADHPGCVAELNGFARGWGVAMDNSVDLPGYKYYVERNGRRPAVFVAFLDLMTSTAPGARVNGICRPVAHDELARLDRRERNYVRVDVSGHFDPAAGRVWTYVGSQAGRDRLRQGSRRGAAVIQAGYLQAVRHGVQRLGGTEHRAFEASLDPRGLPVMELIRCEIAPAG